MFCPLESAALNTKKRVIQFGLSKLSWLLFSHYVMSGCLWPHGLQHTRPPCHSPSPRVCPSSCSLMLSSHLILCCPLLFFLSIFLSTRVFSQWVSCLHQVAKDLELWHYSLQWIFRVVLVPGLKDDPENTKVACSYGMSSFWTSSISIYFLELGTNQILRGTDHDPSKGTLLPSLLFNKFNFY